MFYAGPAISSAPVEAPRNLARDLRALEGEVEGEAGYESMELQGNTPTANGNPDCYLIPNIIYQSPARMARDLTVRPPRCCGCQLLIVCRVIIVIIMIVNVIIIDNSSNKNNNDNRIISLSLWLCAFLYLVHKCTHVCTHTQCCSLTHPSCSLHRIWPRVVRWVSQAP
jgi:hypothetical protein